MGPRTNYHRWIRTLCPTDSVTKNLWVRFPCDREKFYWGTSLAFISYCGPIFWITQKHRCIIKQRNTIFVHRFGWYHVSWTGCMEKILLSVKKCRPYDSFWDYLLSLIHLELKKTPDPFEKSTKLNFKKPHYSIWKKKFYHGITSRNF